MTEHVSPLWTETVGLGPDVVLLHGWGMHSGIFEDVVESLMDDHRVTMVDLPGHGQSRQVEVPSGLAGWCQAVMAAVPHPACWVGWSLGGLIAQTIALKAPARVSRLALIGSSPCFVQRPDWPCAMPPQSLAAFAAEVRRDHRATLNRFIALEVYGSAQASAQLQQLKAMLLQQGEPDRAALEEGLCILEDTDLRADWARLACPTLLMLGERDQLVPVSMGDWAIARAPQVTVETFPRAAHAPFLSHLPAFLTALRAFCASPFDQDADV